MSDYENNVNRARSSVDQSMTATEKTALVTGMNAT